MKTEQNRILKIGSESLLLPAGTTDADMLRVLSVLSNCDVVDCDANYVPDSDSLYSSTAIVLKARQIEVSISVTFIPVLTEAAYQEMRDEGQKLYNATHQQDGASGIRVA